jgi:hypothetical protein
MRARDDSALTEVGCCSQAVPPAGCQPECGVTVKTERHRGPGPDPTGKRGPDEYEPTVDDCDSGRTVTAVRHEHARRR